MALCWIALGIFMVHIASAWVRKSTSSCSRSIILSRRSSSRACFLPPSSPSLFQFRPKPTARTTSRFADISIPSTKVFGQTRMSTAIKTSDSKSISNNNGSMDVTSASSITASPSLLADAVRPVIVNDSLGNNQTEESPNSTTNNADANSNTPSAETATTTTTEATTTDVATPTSTTTATIPTPIRTFYRRSLPETCVAFSSRQGRLYFESAVRHRGLKSFFNLMEQHSTQSEPAYCGISTLVIALNALAVDPGQIWKGNWRWYEESMLNCCVDLEEVKKIGISMPVFNCLAVCQGLVTDLHYVDGSGGNGGGRLSAIAATSTMTTISDASNFTTANTNEIITNAFASSCCVLPPSSSIHHAESDASLTPLEKFRKAVHEACVEDEDKLEEPTAQDCLEENHEHEASCREEAMVDRVLIASYSRKVIGQTGSGHFSPIAAYDKESDSVLIMDTARFKYGAHWVNLPLLFEAMHAVDTTTNRSRGHIMLVNRLGGKKNEAHHPGQVHSLPISILLRTEMKQSRVRREFKEYLESLPIGSRSFQDIEQYCTKNGTMPGFVWEMTQPQLHPVKDDKDSKIMAWEVQSLIRQLLQRLQQPSANDETDSSPSIAGDGSQCRSHHCKAIHLQPNEAMMIIYLACLDESERKALVFDSAFFASERARSQLMAEAELYNYAIMTSDQTASI